VWNRKCLEHAHSFERFDAYGDGRVPVLPLRTSVLFHVTGHHKDVAGKRVRIPLYDAGTWPVELNAEGHSFAVNHAARADIATKFTGAENNIAKIGDSRIPPKRTCRERDDLEICAVEAVLHIFEILEFNVRDLDHDLPQAVFDALSSTDRSRTPATIVTTLGAIRIADCKKVLSLGKQSSDVVARKLTIAIYLTFDCSVISREGMS